MNKQLVKATALAQADSRAIYSRVNSLTRIEEKIESKIVRMREQAEKVRNVREAIKLKDLSEQ